MRSSSSEKGGELLQELEALSQALYNAQVVSSSSHPPPRREFDQVRHRRRVSEAVVRPKSQNTFLESRHSISELIPSKTKSQPEPEHKWVEHIEEEDIAEKLGTDHKRKGFWSWKPLRALAHIGQQRFRCEFSAHVHGIDKLPASLNGLRLHVKLRHHETSVQTMPARVSYGCVEFEEILHFRCTVYGSKKSGEFKYMSKSFELSVVAVDAEELDFGKHQLDLSKILPSGENDQQNVTWNTSFKMSGKAKGGSLWITFGYEMLNGHKEHRQQQQQNSPQKRSAPWSFNSLPSSPYSGKKKSTVVDFGSPALSASVNNVPMDHFKLDEPELAKTESSNKLGLPPALRRLAIATGDVLEHRGRPLFPDIDIAPVTPGRTDVVEDHQTKLAPTVNPDEQEEVREDKVVEQALEVVEQEEDVEEEVNEDKGEDDHEFNVVEQGIETGPLDAYADTTPTSVEPLEEEEGIVDSSLEQEREERREEHDEGVGKYDWERDTEEQVNEDNKALHAGVGKYDWERDSEEQVDEEETVLEQPVFSKSEDEAEIVAGEFLDMLEEQENIEEEERKEAAKEDDGNESDSPRALLLKQFEQEAMLDGDFGITLDEDLKSQEEVPSKEAKLEQEAMLEGDFGMNMDEDLKPKEEELPERELGPDTDEDSDLAAIMDAAETELQKATQAMKSRARAKMLEDAETEALLHEWGIDEEVFHNEEKESSLEEESPAVSNSLVVRQQLPPLAPGFGECVPTSDGGTLRSMDPAHFQGGKNDGKLVMHVSKPVVVPAEMGTSAMDVLRNLAGAGTQTMAAQALEAMPLEDITGKSVQQIAFEGQASYEENNRRYDAALLATNRYALEDGNSSSTAPVTVPASTTSSALYQGKRKEKKRNEQSDFLSLDELAPMAMEKIEELAMQGLKIQCDMTDEEAPYTLEPLQSVPLLKGSSSKLLEGVKSEDTGDGLISMSLTLDEWMRLDAGLVDEDEMGENTRAVMDTHRQAHTTTDLVMNLSGHSTHTKDNEYGKMGNTLTLAMLVQLRDPLRNYEPVGAPMMALVEAERVLVPPRPKLFKRICLKGNSEEEYNDDHETAEVGPKFKITGVHVAGLSVSEDVGDPKKGLKQWGSSRQQQSGSRWLIANGMGKTASSASKHPLLRSKTSKGKQADSSLWSISSAKGGVSRNPDVKFGSKR